MKKQLAETENALAKRNENFRKLYQKTVEYHKNNGKLWDKAVDEAKEKYKYKKDLKIANSKVAEFEKKLAEAEKQLGKQAKKGNWKKALVAGGLALLVGGAAWLLNKCSDDKEKVAPPPAEEPKKPEPEKKPDVYPPKIELPLPKLPDPPKIDWDEIDRQIRENQSQGSEYTVVKGDNVWNIAKRHLTEKNGQAPTNAEILQKTREIMQENGLHLEADGYHCLILPGQKLKIPA